MGFNFPTPATDGDSYELNGVTFTYDGTDACWRRASAKTGFVLKAGDTMSGKLNLIDPNPTTPLEAAHKKYVDETVATANLWQSVWAVELNTPDLDPAIALPLHGYSWTAVTADPNIPEIAPASLPGIGGTVIASNDTIVWNENQLEYEHVRTPLAASAMLVADAPPATAFHGQQWFDSNAGKHYIYYVDPSGDNYWVQTSGGGGGSRYIVPISDTAPTATEEGELWFNSTDASLYVWFDDGTGAQWVDVSGVGGGGGGGLDQATADARYLQLTGGTITNDLTINSTDGPSIKMDKPATNSGVSDLMFGIAGAAYFRLRFTDGVNLQLDTFMSPPTTSNRYAFKIDRVSSKLDFSSTPTVVGAPIVLKSEHDAALARIKTLEDRLSQLERRR